MGRPAISAHKKREKLSISVPKWIKSAATKGGNASQFMEEAAGFYVQAIQLIEQRKKGKTPDFDAEFEDLMDSILVSQRRYEPSIPVEEAFAILRSRRVKKK